MYIVPVEVRESSIDGKGVFAISAIKKGTVVWQYTDGHDRKMTQDAFDKLDEGTKTSLQRVAYLSPTTQMWVIPPEKDPACYTNHSSDAYNTSVVVDKKISDEPLFIANRNIRADEEITNNYLEFDNNTKPNLYSWL